MAKLASDASLNELFAYELSRRNLSESEVAGLILDRYNRDKELGKIPVKIKKSRENTQDEPLDELAIDANYVSRWKLGKLNVSPFYRKLLEDVFGKSIEKLGWPGKNRIPNWHVADPPNPLFTGRNETLTEIHKILKSKSSPVALSGVGGVGKSQIAIEYAHKYMHEYHTVMWLRAGDREILAADFASIAFLIGLDLPKAAQNNQRMQISEVKAWLSHENITRWLLIFDGADDREMINEILKDYVPQPCQGHVIITTRSRPTGLIEHQWEVDPLTIDESAQFLLRRAKIAPGEEDTRLAMLIAEKLGMFPLALEQAGAYIENTGCGLKRYLELYETTGGSKRLLHYEGKKTVWAEVPTERK
jgi:NB-ARC domain